MFYIYLYLTLQFQNLMQYINFCGSGCVDKVQKQFKVAGSIPVWGSEIIFWVSTLKIVHLP